MQNWQIDTQSYIFHTAGVKSESCYIRVLYLNARGSQVYIMVYSLSSTNILHKRVTLPAALTAYK